MISREPEGEGTVGDGQADGDGEGNDDRGRHSPPHGAKSPFLTAADEEGGDDPDDEGSFEALPQADDEGREQLELPVSWRLLGAQSRRNARRTVRAGEGSPLGAPNKHYRVVQRNKSSRRSLPASTVTAGPATRVGRHRQVIEASWVEGVCTATDRAGGDGEEDETIRTGRLRTP